MVTPDVAALTERIPGLHLAQAAPLRFTDKTYTARATLHGMPVVIKALISSDTYWQQRFAHEAETYQAFTASPPLFPVPQLHHADDRLLVLAQLPASSHTTTATRRRYRPPRGNRDDRRGASRPRPVHG